MRLRKFFVYLEVSVKAVKGTRTLFLTTLSKVGSLDMDLVQVFGAGDSNLKNYQWLNLVVRRNEDTWSLQKIGGLGLMNITSGT